MTMIGWLRRNPIVRVMVLHRWVKRSGPLAVKIVDRAAQAAVEGRA